MSLLEQLAEKVERPIHTFKVPASAAKASLIPVETIGLVELNGDEEIQAAKRSRGDGARLAYELAKTSLVEVNGEKVSLADGTADKIWSRVGPKVRSLIVQAYADLHTPADEELADFLGSRQGRL